MKKVCASSAENAGRFATTEYGATINAFDRLKQNPMTTSKKATRPNSAFGKARNNASEATKFAPETLNGPSVAMLYRPPIAATWRIQLYRAKTSAPPVDSVIS